ncbi:MAG: biotin/lipoyl-binding protein, partial [Sphingomonadales bacterium]
MIRTKPYIGARRIILASGVAMFVFVSWASFARVDEVTRGQGRVIPSSKAQIVQSAEPATIRDIVVRPGQAVRKGQLLVRLDDTESSAQLGQIEAENRSLEARAARLSREGTGGMGNAD